MNEDASVYQLISRLCASLIKESDEGVEGLSLNCAKSIAFKILLQSKSQILEPENLIKECQFREFELSLANRHKDAKQVNQFVELVKGDSSAFSAVSWLLVSLANIDPDPEFVKHQNEKNFFKIPSNFQQLNKRNVFLTSKSTHQLIHLPSTASTPSDDCSYFSNILEAYTGNQAKKACNQLPPNLSLKRIEAPESAKVCARKIRINKTWESLADVGTANRSFSSESRTSIRQQLSATRSKHAVEFLTVPFDKLLNDIKLLAIGIESESFKKAPDDSQTFLMPHHLSCDDISDISQVAEEFLETGACFRRLKTFTSKNPFNQSYIVEGFIFKVFCDCVIKFLNHYRDVVYSQDVQTLLQLSINSKDIRKVLVHITKFLNIHPASTFHSKLPTGSDFLGLLYNEYTTILNADIKCFFVECLRSCCQIYFTNFHKWLFYGHIDDPHKELFIYFVDHYRPNTKYFFDKAYLVRKQSVPGFLQGFADNILLCGKYTMLLKSYNHVHPLFMIPKPSLKVCLTNDEISEMRAQCEDFVKEARAACGQSISIRKIMQERQQAKRDKFRKAEAASTKNAIRWRKEQEDRRIDLAEKREIKMQELRKELQRIEDKKILKRMEEIQAERDFLDAADEMETNAIEQENVELRKRIEVYEQLNNQLDVETEQREKLVVQLKNTLESKDDILNANEAAPSTEVAATDEMNNLIPKTTFTDAQRNRMKIMSHEYNVVTHDEPCEDVVTAPTHRPLSQAQKNKLKVLGHEFALIEEAPAPQIKVQDCDKLTDLQRNRLKVLSHEYNLETDKPSKVQPGMSLNLLQVESTQQQLESPMSVTSDHFSNESEHNTVESKSPDDDAEMEKSGTDAEELEMLKAFEEAIEKNQSSFLGINLNDYSTQSSSYEHIKTTDTMALSRFLQMSLMIPVNAYMDILNNETLKMFIQDLDILMHFKSLRNYFLMMNGEFGSSICDQLFTKLESGVKPIELLNYQSLHMILDQALSRSRHDGNTEQLSFIVKNIPEKFELHSPGVLNMLTMSYKLEWPLNLILNPETMEQYQAIFNYLLKLKRISWLLEDCFQRLKELHKQHGKNLLTSQQFRNVQQIRHKMMHFVHCLENHVTRNVLQISWIAFVDDLKSAQSIHCIYRKHTSYLKRVLFLCLLNKKSFEFQKTIEDSFKVILKFHKHLKAKDWVEADGSYTHPKYSKIEADAEDFERLIKFIMYLGNKIVQHGYQKEIYDLLYLIDINGYYSDS